MDRRHIEESKAKGRLVLGKEDDPYAQTSPYFRGGWTMRVLCIVFIAAYFYPDLRGRTPIELLFITAILLVIAASILYEWRFYRRSLRLTQIATPLPRSEISARMAALAQEHGWEILTDQPEQIIIQTEPALLPKDGGERIFILPGPGIAHVASIASTSSLKKCRDGRRRNDRNIELLRLALARRY